MKIHAKTFDKTAPLAQSGAQTGRTDSDGTAFGEALSTLADESGRGAGAEDAATADAAGGNKSASGTGAGSFLFGALRSPASAGDAPAPGSTLALSAALGAEAGRVGQSKEPNMTPFRSLSSETAIAIPDQKAGEGSVKPSLGLLDLAQVAASAKGPSASVQAATQDEPASLTMPGIADLIVSKAAGLTKASESAPSSKSSVSKPSSPDTTTAAEAAVPSLAGGIDPALLPVVPAIMPQIAARQADAGAGDPGPASSSAAALAAQAALAASLPSSWTKAEKVPAAPIIGDVRFENHLAPVSSAPAQPQATGTAAEMPSASADASSGSPSSDASLLATETVSSAKPRASDDTPASPVTGVSLNPEPTDLPGFAPSLSAPTRTVLNALTSLAAAAAPSTTDMADTVARAAPARTMTLQLTPGDLGTVSVRLHRTGHTLDVSLTASSEQTTGLLNRERDALGSALRGHDYQVNSLVIQGADAQSRGDASPQSGGFGSSAQDMQQGRGPSDERSGASGGSGRQAQDESAPRQNGSRNAATSPSSSGDRDRGHGLFL